MTNTPPANPYGKAVGAYQNTYQTQMSGFEIVAELYKGIIRNIRMAKEAHQDERLEDMVNINAKTFKIIMALDSHVNEKEGGEAAAFLKQFYASIFGRLSAVLRAEDTQAEFDGVLEEIQPVYEIWMQHARDAQTQNSEVTEQTTSVTT